MVLIFISANISISKVQLVFGLVLVYWGRACWLVFLWAGLLNSETTISTETDYSCETDHTSGMADVLQIGEWEPQIWGCLYHCARSVPLCQDVCQCARTILDHSQGSWSWVHHQHVLEVKSACHCAIWHRTVWTDCGSLFYSSCDGL